MTITRRARAYAAAAALAAAGLFACNALTGINDLAKVDDAGCTTCGDAAVDGMASVDAAALDAGSDALGGDAGCDAGAPECAGDAVKTCVGGAFITTQCSGMTPVCFAGVCRANRSCQGDAGPGAAHDCGPNGNEDCCASSGVLGATFLRSFDNVTFTDSGAPATVSDFRLDKYEITVGRFRAFVNAGKGTMQDPPAVAAGELPSLSGSGWQASWNANLPTDTATLKTQMTCVGYPTWTDAVDMNERLPITCLSFYEAFAFCIWDGGRLPTESEWNYAAAGGTEQRVLPWSMPATSTTVDALHAVYGCPSSCLAAFRPVGSLQAGIGRFQQYDLAGNANEWTLDCYGAYPLPCPDCANLACASTGETRVFRGGALDSSATDLYTGNRYPIPTASRYPDLGARCARRY